MYNVSVICVGKLKEKYLSQAIAEYSKRLSAFCRFNIIEVDEERICETPSQSQIENVIEAEGKRILGKLPPNPYLITMCIEGEVLSSEQFAGKLAQAGVRGFGNIVLVIGGSWGLSESVKRLSAIKLSMGRMTFPHQLARVMLCEQIYRAFQINNNGKYHK